MVEPAWTRQCAVAGFFYPSDPAVLRQEVMALLRKANQRNISGIVRGLVSPHAGYPYSGLTAAHAYALLQGKRYSTVVIVSPSHREYFNGVSVFPGEFYATPLGDVQINSELRDELLRECPLVQASDAGHHDEHAIEVQLPFLQEVLRNFTILPVVMGDQRRDMCLELAGGLARIAQDENVLFIASTDLSHYHSSEIAEQLDAVMIEDVRAFDWDRLMQDLDAHRTEACGGGPTVAVMAALSDLGVTRMEILNHCNSGDVTGDRDRVVGYLAAAAVA